MCNKFPLKTHTYVCWKLYWEDRATAVLLVTMRGWKLGLEEKATELLATIRRWKNMSTHAEDCEERALCILGVCALDRLSQAQQRHYLTAPHPGGLTARTLAPRDPTPCRAPLAR